MGAAVVRIRVLGRDGLCWLVERMNGETVERTKEELEQIIAASRERGKQLNRGRDARGRQQLAYVLSLVRRKYLCVGPAKPKRPD